MLTTRCVSDALEVELCLILKYLKYRHEYPPFKQMRNMRPGVNNLTQVLQLVTEVVKIQSGF